MLPKFALADEMQDLRRRSIAQASQTDPTAQRRNQAQRVSTRETERRSFPLSFAQQRLWVLDRLEPGNGVYNLAFAVRLAGALDLDALQSALGCWWPSASKLGSLLCFHSSTLRGLQRERPSSSNSCGSSF